MAVATEKVAERYFDIATGVQIDVDIPIRNDQNVLVYFGTLSEQAILNVDYTVEELGPSQFNTFKLTPLASLLEKINNLIAADPVNEINAITVRRRNDLLTSATPDFAKNPTWLSREFDVITMRLQEMEERVNRSLTLANKYVGNQPIAQLMDLVARTVLVVSDDGLRIEAGPNLDQIFGSAQAAADAIAAADAAALSETNANASKLAAQSARADAESAAVTAANARDAAQNAQAAAEAALADIGATVVATLLSAVVKADYASVTGPNQLYWEGGVLSRS